MIDKKFLLNFGSLNFSSLFNKAVSFLYVVTLIRLLPPEAFGIYSLVWAHLGLLAAWEDLGTTPYGLLQGTIREKKTLNNIFTLRLALGVVVSILTVAAALIFNYPREVVGVIVIFSTLYFHNAVTGFFLIIASLQKKLHLPAVFSIVFNLVLILGNIILLIFTRNIYLVFGLTALNYLLYGLIILWVTRRRFFRVELGWDIATIRKVVRKSLVFSLISFFASIYFKADFVIINHILGPVSLAVYSAAYKFYEVPLLLIANYNFSSIPTFRNLYRESLAKFKKKILADSLFLTGLSLIVVLGTWVAGGPIISAFFSDRYTESIPVLNILILALPFLLLTSVFLNAIYAKGEERRAVGGFAALAAINIGANIILVPIYGYRASALITVATEVIATLIFGGYLFFSIRYVQDRN